MNAENMYDAWDNGDRHEIRQQFARREDITRMARQAGFVGFDGDNKNLREFAALVAAAEREKSLRLWMLLDDIDTADDIAKADDKLYRSICQKHQKKRWEILSEEEVDAALGLLR